MTVILRFSMNGPMSRYEESDHIYNDQQQYEQQQYEQQQYEQQQYEQQQYEQQQFEQQKYLEQQQQFLQQQQLEQEKQNQIRNIGRSSPYQITPLRSPQANMAAFATKSSPSRRQQPIVPMKGTFETQQMYYNERNDVNQSRNISDDRQFTKQKKLITESRSPIKGIPTELNKAYNYDGSAMTKEQFDDFYPEDEVKEVEDSQWIFDNEKGWVPNPRASPIPLQPGSVRCSSSRTEKTKQSDKKSEENFTLLSEHPAKGLGAKISAVLGGDVVTVIGSQTGNEPLDNSAAPPPPAPDYPRLESPRSGSGLRRSPPVDPSKKLLYQSKVTEKVTVAPLGNRVLPEPSSLSKKEIWKNSTRTESMLWSTVDDEDPDFSDHRLPTTFAGPAITSSQSWTENQKFKDDPSITVTAPQDYSNHRLPLIPPQSKGKRGSFERQNEIIVSENQTYQPTPVTSQQYESFRSIDQKQPQKFQLPSSQFQQPPSSQFQQPPSSQFQQPPNSQFQQPPSSPFGQLQTSMYQEQPTSMFQQPETSVFQQPQTSMFQQPNTSMFQQPSFYQEQPTSYYGEQPTSQYIQTSQYQTQPQISQFQQPQVSSQFQPTSTSQFPQQPQTTLQQTPLPQFQQPQTTQFQTSIANQFSDQSPRIIEPAKSEYDQISSASQVLPSDQYNQIKQPQLPSQLPSQSALKSEGRLMVEQKTVTFSDVNREHTFNTSQESGSSYLDSGEQHVPTSVDQFYGQSEKTEHVVVSSPQVLNEKAHVDPYAEDYEQNRTERIPSMQDSSMVASSGSILPEHPSEKLKEDLPRVAQEGEEVVSALKEFEPPNTEGMSKARIRWLAAFNKIVSEMVEVSFTFPPYANRNLFFASFLSFETCVKLEVYLFHDEIFFFPVPY